jgi:NTF2 fold immunity protein
VMNIKRVGLVALLMCPMVAVAVGYEEHSVKPEAGFIPNQATATRVAEAILIPIYGQEQIESERPFSAQLNENTWKVEGHLAAGMDGGVAEVWIDKRDGRILRVSHGK